MEILKALWMVAVIAIWTIIYGIVRKHMIEKSSYLDYEIDLECRLVLVWFIILICVAILSGAIAIY